MRWVVVICALAGCRQILGIDDLTATSDVADGPGPEDAAISVDAVDDVDARPRDADPPDAVPPDAAFDPATCPSDYTITHGMSRYRHISNGSSLAARHGDCADDLAGATHLAAFDSLVEAITVTGDVPGGDNLWVGTVQLPGQSTVGAGWIQITGGPTPAAIWGPGQPNDDDGDENGVQDFAVINASGGGLNDSERTFSFGAICECDGLAIDPIAAALIAP